jgi:nitroreductase
MTDVSTSTATDMAPSRNTAGYVDFVRGLRQVRQFRPEVVPEAALRDILEVARWTGSARNLQPWDLIVIRDRRTLQALATIEGGHGPHLASAGLGIALVMSGDPEHFDFDTYDEGRLSERIMLAAAAHGLGSAIGWFKDSAADEARRLLGVPPERLLRTVMSIGTVDREAHRQRTRPERPRKPLDQMVRYERW